MGLAGYSAFYRDIHPLSQTASQGAAVESKTAPDHPTSRAVDAALRNHFDLTLDQLEQRFVEALHRQQASPADAEDLRLTVQFYDTARRYQQALDPSAHFLTAWLLITSKCASGELSPITCALRPAGKSGVGNHACLCQPAPACRRFCARSTTVGGDQPYPGSLSSRGLGHLPPTQQRRTTWRWYRLPWLVATSPSASS